jgi:hypothetical protein
MGDPEQGQNAMERGGQGTTPRRRAEWARRRAICNAETHAAS